MVVGSPATIKKGALLMYKILAAKTATYSPYRLTIFAVLLGIVAFSGCSASKQVTRVDADTTIDLSGRWNDTDSRMVADEIIGDCLNHPWINDHGISAGGKPVVIVGGIRNKSMEHIPVATFITDIERAFINSGKVRTVSGASERGEIREERADQGEFAAIETIKTDGTRTRRGLYDDG